MSLARLASLDPSGNSTPRADQDRDSRFIQETEKRLHQYVVNRDELPTAALLLGHSTPSAERSIKRHTERIAYLIAVFEDRMALERRPKRLRYV